MPHRSPRLSSGFTIIELLVVISIIAILLAILLPAAGWAQRYATRTACASNLRQIGVAIDTYRSDSGDKYPPARYMPSPFVSTSDDPPLPRVLGPRLSSEKVYKCPGDSVVFDLAGISYVYNNALSGRSADESWFARRLDLPKTQIPVAYDCDGNTFTLEGGEQITVDFFHLQRNLLFADGHVGDYTD